jgi:hypothetical protein
MDLLTETQVKDLPVGILEFVTAEGRVCIRGMQAFRLAMEVEPLTFNMETRWRARTGERRLEVKHVLLSPRDAWSLR